MKRTFTVVGLGAFGSTVARELSRLGNDVLCIDMNAERVNEIADDVTQAVVADARNEDTLRDLGVHESDAVVVAIGEDLEANILVTLTVKNMPKPEVWAKALNHNHHRILHKLGADHIVHPEHEMGMRLAHAMMYPEVVDYISLGHDVFTVEVRASEKIAGQTIAAMKLEENDVRLLLVKHQRDILTPPPADYVFRLGDQLVLAGMLQNLRNISVYL
ncbi:MAG TPA: TrkA family potassium uptake protein [Oxalicibacterium sp.]|uniref:potassium channel family protein n=1 Tax=Oxalicibacterium sp. TaxID=2766525 RepID=UPI002BF7DDAD|nr:TrkA family potassium uptake protein [Oxalicibacterium sp.]HWU98763.1 TrkA family potassium uptake protein [Oxalicibacterium sp.]